MLFVDKEHMRFFNKKVAECKLLGKIDSQTSALLYLLALTSETRTHFEEIFNMKEGMIKPESVKAGWQTGTTIKVSRLAFNLFNGYIYDNCGSDKVSRYYAVDDIFNCNLAMYFFEAIKLRYPEYFCKEDL